MFTISDGVNDEYTRDLNDTTVVRAVKLTDDEDTQVAELWIVYDRSKEDGSIDVVTGNYAYGMNINIKVDARDRRNDPLPQANYDFGIETEEEHNNAETNLPSTTTTADSPSAGLTTISIDSGDLEGAEIIYDSSEPVAPTFGPLDEIPPLDIADVDGVGVPMNLQPPTVFNIPVKLFIPCPEHKDVSELSVYYYNGIDWALACDASGSVQAGGEGWMVPNSRANHNNGSPSTIEIQVYHFSGAQAGSPTTPASTGGVVGGGGGCFIATAAFGSNMERHVQILSGFRDKRLVNNYLGRKFIALYYINFLPRLPIF
jgi:hypothetical protein